MLKLDNDIQYKFINNCFSIVENKGLLFNKETYVIPFFAVSKWRDFGIYIEMELKKNIETNRDSCFTTFMLTDGPKIKIYFDDAEEKKVFLENLKRSMEFFCN